MGKEKPEKGSELAGRFTAMDMTILVLLKEVFKDDMSRLDYMLSQITPPDELNDPVSESHRSLIKFYRSTFK